VTKVLDMGAHLLPVARLLLGVSQLLEFAVAGLQFGGKFPPPELEFTKSYGLDLICVPQAFAWPLHPTLALQELFLLSGERGQIVLCGLGPALVEVRQESRCS
jgi:hypothetical protein